MSDIRLPEYLQAQTELTTASLSVTPAELQGLITGMLSGGLSLESDSRKTLLFDYTNDGMGGLSMQLKLQKAFMQYLLLN